MTRQAAAATPLPVGWKWQIDQIVELGEEPFECPTCAQPGYVAVVDGRGELVRHLGRQFLCRAPGGPS